jgi:hypothetical protein
VIFEIEDEVIMAKTTRQEDSCDYLRQFAAPGASITRGCEFMRCLDRCRRSLSKAFVVQVIRGSWPVGLSFAIAWLTGRLCSSSLQGTEWFLLIAGVFLVPAYYEITDRLNLHPHDEA